MRYWLGLFVLALSISLAPTASARSTHVGIFVTIQGDGRVQGCSGNDCIDCHLQAPGDMEGCATGIATPGEGGGGITLVAIPGPGQIFGGWGGECSGTGSCGLDSEAPHSVSASFTEAPPPPPPKFPLTVAKTGSGSGYVGGGGVDCGTICSSSQAPQAAFQLVAVADQGSKFTGWGGACSGLDPCQVTMAGAISVTAGFDRLPQQVRALASVGVPGKESLLRYQLVNAAPGHREGMTVHDGKRTVVQIALAHTRFARGTYFIPWQTPGSLEQGVLRFCIVTMDPATNERGRSCAQLTIR